MRNLTCTLVLALALFGCGDDDDGSMVPGGADAATDTADAATDTADAAVDAMTADAAPTACVFNSDCPDEQRCVDSSGMCELGERGTGVNGVDACESGNDCASAVCVEGPESADEDFYCSGECEDDDDCTGMLPRCLEVAFLGRICAREPEA